MSWYLKLFARICANASWKFHTPPLPSPLCLITCFLIRNPPHFPPFALEEDTHRESVKLIKISTHDFALLLYDSAFVCLHRKRGERAKGSNDSNFATTRCRNHGWWEAVGRGGILLLMNISKPERHAARNFQHTDCQLNSDSNNPPTIIPPPSSLSLNTLTPPYSFIFPLLHTHFLCLRWDKCKTLTGISLAESIAKLLVSFMFLFTDTTNSLHGPLSRRTHSAPLLVITFDDLLHGARAVNCQ